MSVIYRLSHNEAQQFQSIIGFSNLCFYKQNIIYYDVNNCRIAYINTSNDKQNEANNSSKSEFVNLKLKSFDLIKDITDVQCLYVQGDHLILANNEHMMIYRVSEKNMVLSVQFISKITLPIKSLPIKCIIRENVLILASTFENKVFLYKNLVTDEITQQTYIAQNNIIDTTACNGNVYVITSNTIIQLSIDDLNKSQQHELQLQGSIKIALTNESQKQMILFSDKRQMLVVSLENYSIVQTQQKVTKTDPLYGAYISALDKIVIIGEGNEIIYLNAHEAKKTIQQDKRITQVKQDFYDTQFRTDGFIYGFSYNTATLACQTSNFIYFWTIK